MITVKMAESQPQSVASTTQHTTSPPEQYTSKVCLDHIIVLLPYEQLLDLPAWLTSNFTITPGGQHADKKTENKLILFFDGSYIELIAFIDDDPKHKEGHWWGEKQPGIIDYALTTDEDAHIHWEAMQARLANFDARLLKYDYDSPVAGGRQRPDGVQVKWNVTFPKRVQRGELPFFCHDVTPRDRRVPFSEEACTHPCRAYGVKSLTVTPSIAGSNTGEFSSVYSTVLDEAREDGNKFGLETVRSVPVLATMTRG